MKKYLGLFVLVAGGLFIGSCDSNLLDDYTPGALLADTAITKSSDLVGLMNTAYATLTPTSEIDFTSTFTDEAALGYANGGQGLDGNLAFTLNSTSEAPAGIWATHYFTLAYVNRVIKFSDNITAVDAADQAVIDRAVAEALTLRAYCHLQLLSYFSPNPKDPAALGVILSNDVYLASYVAPRETNAVIYAQIDADLEQAQALYATPALSSGVNPIRANKNFTTAVRARSYAIRGDYANALVYADQVINTSGLTLATFANYLAVFHTDTNTATSEVIFKLDKINGETKTGGLWASVNAGVNGSPFFEMGRGLFNVLNTTAQPTATPLTITAIAGSTLTVPGNTLAVNDMFVVSESRPLNATTSNGIATTPGNSLLAGKVYWVKSVSGNNITLTDTAFGTTTINFAGAVATFTPVGAFANAGDIRYATLVHPTSIINPNYMTVTDFRNTDKLALRKYPGTASNGQLVNDIKIARLTEMYFIRAEALISAGDLTGAAAVIKQVRDARFNRPQPLPVYGSATEAWKDVLLERRKDFALEGYRYIDLKRLGALADEAIERDPRDCEINGACGLPVTDYRFTLPIPQIESNPNPGILAQQNPGY
jgi:hypothetical protein